MAAVATDALQAANANDKLSPGLRATYFTTPRPVYELYDLEADPGELNNLSGTPQLAATERELRTALAELHRLESHVEVTYESVSAEDLAARSPGAYDVVTCMEMLEHVPDPAAIISACAALLKPGGTLILSTLTRTAASFALGIVAAEYLLKLVPQGTHDWQRFIKPSELLAMADRAGLLSKGLCGMSYNPLSGQVRLTPARVVVNYLAHLEKPL